MLALAAGVLAALDTVDAAACSCLPSTPRADYRNADAAFIGRLVKVRRVGIASAVLRYRVERSYKRRLGDIVGIWTPFYGPSCGLPRQKGRRYALFIYRDGRKWGSNLCSLTTPGVLRDAARRSGRARASRRACAARQAPGTTDSRK